MRIRLQSPRFGCLVSSRWLALLAVPALVLSGCDFLKNNSVAGQFLDDEKFETETLDEVESFDTQSETYEKLASLPERVLTETAVSVAGQVLVTAGGQTGTFLFDPLADGGAGEWQQLDDLPDARAQAVALSAGSLVLVFGGATSDGPVRFIDHLDVSAPTPLWQREAIPGAIDAPREMAAVVLGQTLFMFGGLDEQGDASADLITLDLTKLGDPAAFTLVPDALPEARTLAAAFVASAADGSDRIHIVSGNDENGGILATEVVFNPADGSHLEDAIPTGRVDPQIVVGVDEVLCLWSRTRDGGRDNRVDLYDVAAGTWSAGPSYPQRFRLSAAVFVDGRFHVFGGVGNGESQRDANVLQGDTWQSLPGTIERRQSAFAASLDALSERVTIIGGEERRDKDPVSSPL